MSKVIEVIGYSDDVLLICNIDQIDCFNKEAVFKLTANEEQILVIGRYFNDTWLLGIAQVSEDQPIPDNWKIEITQSKTPYSPLLRITCPENTTWEEA